MTDQLPEYLRLYDQEYFTGGRSVSGYNDYHTCRSILDQWSGMVEALARPESVLDVGCAYGFVVQFFLARGIPAIGIEPSAFARSQVPALLRDYVLPGALPELPATSVREAYSGSEPGRFDVVTCTEVLEHVPENLVARSLAALADKSDRLLITLVMLEDHPTAHDDAGHLCLHNRAWWDARFDETGLRQRTDLERILSDDPYSKAVGWSGRLFVRERTP